MIPGKRTSEFKLAAGVIVCLALVLAVAIWKHSELLAVAAIAGKAVTSAAYGAARAITKRAALSTRHSSLSTVSTDLAWLRRRLGQFITHTQPATMPAEGSIMNPLFASAGTFVANKIPASLALTPAEKTDVAALVAQGIKVGVDLATKLIAQKYPAVATMITGLLAEIAPAAA